MYNSQINNLTPFGKATQSSDFGDGKYRPEYAIKPPISNEFNTTICSHTYPQDTPAWWMFQFSFGSAYVTNINIYYRKDFAHRMDGFKLYVANTSTIPPDGYLCYEDPDSGLPDITQTIPCNQIGQYVIYYDNLGSDEGKHGVFGPIVELCYVAINGCPKSHWGSQCENFCADNCIQRNCFPENGSCVWGCNPTNCLNYICNKDTAVCTDGCKDKRTTGSYCNEYNVAYDGLVFQYPSGSQPANLANDGDITYCSKTKGLNVTFQVDIKEKSISTGMYIAFGDTFMKYKQEASGCKCDPKYCKPDCENDKECKTKIQYIIDNAAYNLDIDKIFYKKEFYTWIQILVFTMMMVLKHVKSRKYDGSKLGDLTDEIVSKHNANHIKQFISAGPKDYSMKLDTEKLVSCCKGFRLNAEVEEKITLDKK
ncbi:unnamed protein product [Mytilus coruscus]|uniref:Fucolectin tachylectin-4 pentraxin-1 domain-containing protein n=1 Tax=Mytilus coruscus TaxID=42192 RepID=A0A6J8AA07_MYTCO|nr:unnamed protein product [Mytilus coruscus]